MILEIVYNILYMLIGISLVVAGLITNNIIASSIDIICGIFIMAITYKEWWKGK
jgi:hypothetical protein